MCSRALRLVDSDLGSLPGGTYHHWNCRMHGDVSFCSVIFLCCFCFLLGRALANCLRIARRLPGYLHCRGQWASFFFYRKRLDALLDHYLARLSRQDHAFSLLGSLDDSFPV